MSLSLVKGQSISLEKKSGGALTQFTLGLGWDQVSQSEKRGFFRKLASVATGGEIDLDASAIEFDASGNYVDAIWYGHLRSNDGGVRHTGDNLTGEGDGDDEQIIVDLSSVAPNVQYVVFVITSYGGQTFNQVENVFARVVDDSGVEVVRYDLAQSAQSSTAKIVAKLVRSGSGWDFVAIGADARGKTVRSVIGDAQAAL